MHPTWDYGLRLLSNLLDILCEKNIDMTSFGIETI